MSSGVSRGGRWQIGAGQARVHTHAQELEILDTLNWPEIMLSGAWRLILTPPPVRPPNDGPVRRHTAPTPSCQRVWEGLVIIPAPCAEEACNQMSPLTVSLVGGLVEV